MNYSGKFFLVLGFGKTGQSIVKWLSNRNVKIRVADSRKNINFPNFKKKFSLIEFLRGKFSLDLLNGIDIIFVSPGLSPKNDLQELLPEIKKRKIPILSDIELFSLALKELTDKNNYKPKIIAITGTNGKTTVTSLTSFLCKRSGFSVKEAGNIGSSVLDVLIDSIEKNDLPDIWVLELSSFQLYSTSSLSANAATVLNISEDHLDWHENMSDYVLSKSKIFSKGTLQVLNRDDKNSIKMALNNETILTFGLNNPSKEGCFGIIQENNIEWITRAVLNESIETNSYLKLKNKNYLYMNKLIPSDILKIKGKHNLCNVMASFALCSAIGIELDKLLYAVSEYEGEPHRFSFVNKINDVEFFDDGKGTNTGATIAAIDALSKFEKKIILILGGDSKGQNFNLLNKYIKKYVKHIILIGVDALKIEHSLKKCRVELNKCFSLREAVKKSLEVSMKGDKVLFSPACASFDMFSDYKERSQVFINEVNKLEKNSTSVNYEI